MKKKFSSRDTCLCKTHANFDFLIQRLAHLKLVLKNNARKFIESLVCNVNNKDCMYRVCSKCKNRKLKNTKNIADNTFYYRWITQKVSRVGAKNKIYNVTLTEKEKVVCTVSKLIDEVNSQSHSYLKHVYDTTHQFDFQQKNLSQLVYNEVKLVIDFSQNYNSKYSSEIQAVHFGASRKQISLHTGVLYYKDVLDSTVKCMSFCTVSECLRHDASAIWAHLQPVLEFVKSIVPSANIIHFQSDGPSTQYKNKTNFQLFKHFCEKLGFVYATWNFSTPGHGKSAADATGGSVKRICDNAVLSGHDILTEYEIVEAVERLPNSKIKVLAISLADIEQIDKLINPDIKTAPKSTQIYQLLWISKPEKLFLNYLSCLQCIQNPPCKHFSLIENGWTLTNKKKVGHSKIVDGSNIGAETKNDSNAKQVGNRKRVDK